MPRVALVTCLELPEPDPDRELLLDACEAEGLEPEYSAWDDPSVAWSSYDLAVVRSSWDYYVRPGAFQDWIERAGAATRLWNPPVLMLANVHKSYLVKLEQEGVPVTPTRMVDRNVPTSVSDVLTETGWNRFVVKPAISASSFKTRLFSADQLPEAQSHLEDVLTDRDAIVQKYMPLASEGGELALIHIDGEFSHAVVKNPRFHADDECVSNAIQPPDEALAVARLTLSKVESSWLYARVDLMRSEEGGWVLSELEMIEPSLYFLQYPPALRKFARAVKGLLARV